MNAPINADVKIHENKMRAYERTHWNKIAWEKDFTIRDEGPYGTKLRTDVILEEIQPKNKPDARIKTITIKLLMNNEDCYQKQS
jgi:hypothetical protein